MFIYIFLLFLRFEPVPGSHSKSSIYAPIAGIEVDQKTKSHRVASKPLQGINYTNPRQGNSPIDRELDLVGYCPVSLCKVVCKDSFRSGSLNEADNHHA